ncbi:hypothetical protein, partial [Streptomyces sp. NPDC056056]|uniref:hypothetical protein n=1 Tax=Streptomyces sp. NPDC056056 TaxID=3345698 RepID=UPI0035DCDCE4
MEAKTCPRCGEEVPSAGRGRPRVWCSNQCRRLASEERRAVRSTGAVVEIHEEIRERIVERSRPISPDGAIDRVLSDREATLKLLRVLAHRMRADPPTTQVDRWLHQAFKPILHDLWQAYHEAADNSPPAMPEVMPAPYSP